MGCPSRRSSALSTPASVLLDSTASAVRAAQIAADNAVRAARIAADNEVREAQITADLKRDMLARGLSVEEVVGHVFGGGLEIDEVFGINSLHDDLLCTKQPGHAGSGALVRSDDGIVSGERGHGTLHLDGELIGSAQMIHQPPVGGLCQRAFFLLASLAHVEGTRPCARDSSITIRERIPELCYSAVIPDGHSGFVARRQWPLRSRPA